MAEPDISRQEIDARFAAVDKQFVGEKELREFAYESMEKRLEGMNEFRDTLRDQAAKFVLRSEMDALTQDVRMLRESKAALEGKASEAANALDNKASKLSQVLNLIGLLVTAALAVWGLLK